MKIGNLEVYGVIYKITNKINGKVYIGQTIQSNGFDDRYKYNAICDIEKVYKYYQNRKDWSKYWNKHLVYAIEKYGFEAFEVDKVFDVAFSREELNVKEQSWILIYDSYNNGYNNDGGGSIRRKFKVTEETKEKISKALKGKYTGENNPFYGKQHSEETKEKISKTRKGKYTGEKAGHYGKPHSDEAKQKISNSRKGFKCTEETKEKLSKARLANPVNCVKIICLETLEVFDSISEASRIKNCNRKGISNCLSGRAKSSGGYHWMYYEDYINNNRQVV